MKKYLFLFVFLVGCTNEEVVVSRTEIVESNFDNTIGIRRVVARFPSDSSNVDARIIDVVNDELRFMDDRKIIAITDEPSQGGAYAINIIYTKDNDRHSYYCIICKKPNISNLVAVTSISGWRGSVAYYVAICDKVEENEKSLQMP